MRASVYYMVLLSYPTEHRKLHLDRCSRFRSAHGRESLGYTLQRAAISLFKMSLRVGELNLHLARGSFGPRESTTQRHLRRFSRFCTARDLDRQSGILPSVTEGRIYVACYCDVPKRYRLNRGYMCNLLHAINCTCNHGFSAVSVTLVRPWTPLTYLRLQLRFHFLCKLCSS